MILSTNNFQCSHSIVKKRRGGALASPLLEDKGGGGSSQPNPMLATLLRVADCCISRVQEALLELFKKREKCPTFKCDFSIITSPGLPHVLLYTRRWTIQTCTFCMCVSYMYTMYMYMCTNDCINIPFESSLPGSIALWSEVQTVNHFDILIGQPHFPHC